MTMRVTTESGIASVIIDRPEKRNAISMAMRSDIQRIFQDLQDDNNVRVIILAGSGEHFSAGADVGEMGSGGIGGSLHKMRALHRMCRAVAHTHKPVISAVRGVCVGVAWSLALASDFIIAASDARFQFAFRHIGLAPDGASSFLLARYVGLMRAKEIVYSGRFVSGVEAAELGLALEAVPSEAVHEHAIALASKFVDAPTLAIAMAKRQFDAAAGQTFDQAIDFEAVMQPAMTMTDDFREGTTAFKKKRKATYKGA